jgi:hypothetical protein
MWDWLKTGLKGIGAAIAAPFLIGLPGVAPLIGSIAGVFAPPPEELAVMAVKKIASTIIGPKSTSTL